MLMKESGEFYLVSRACQDKIMHCTASGSKAVESVDGAKRNETDSIVTLNVKMKDLAPGSPLWQSNITCSPQIIQDLVIAMRRLRKHLNNVILNLVADRFPGGIEKS